jgi:hypothetical protein
MRPDLFSHIVLAPEADLVPLVAHSRRWGALLAGSVLVVDVVLYGGSVGLKVQLRSSLGHSVFVSVEVSALFGLGLEVALSVLGRFLYPIKLGGLFCVFKDFRVL